MKYPSPGWFQCFTLTPDLDLAAVAGDQTRVFDLRDERELWNWEGGCGVLALSPDGSILAPDSGADILLLDVRTGEEITRLHGHQASIRALVFWPDGNKLASSSADQTIRIWDVVERTCVDTLRGHRPQVWLLALMPRPADPGQRLPRRHRLPVGYFRQASTPGAH